MTMGRSSPEALPASSVVLKISLLVYDSETHRFRNDVSIQREQVQQQDLFTKGRGIDIEPPQNTDLDSLSSSSSPSNTEWTTWEKAAVEFGLEPPSETWLEEYRAWNNFNCEKGHPVFDCVDDLNAFNRKGIELAERLDQEMNKKNPNIAVVVDPFQPVYCSIEVGDPVVAWWHVRDRFYRFVVPIQQLPVSCDLKSRLQAWRCKKGSNWLDPTYCRALSQESHELEQRILWELNVRIMEPAGGQNDKTQKESTDKVSTGKENSQSIREDYPLKAKPGATTTTSLSSLVMIPSMITAQVPVTTKTTTTPQVKAAQ